MEKTWYCPFSGSARGVVEYQNTRIKPSNIPTYIRLFYFPINYCWFQLMMAAKRELKVDAASQPPSFFVFGPTSLCTNAPSPTKIKDRKILFFLREGAVVHRLGTQGLLDMASPCSE